MSEPILQHVSPGRSRYRTKALLDFVGALMSPEDGILKKIRTETTSHGLPPIHIGPEEGKILDFLARACRAVKAVEVGTLAGYSACWIARALPSQGVLHTLEYDPKAVRVARENIRRAGLEKKIIVHEGKAAETLKKIQSLGPFDFCFIDADKINYPLYLRWAIRNLRPGGIVAGDNAYLFGKIHLKPEEAGEEEPAVAPMREFLKTMADPRFFSSAAMLPTGEGLAVAVKK